ncbi:MAG TPA: universal stress protein [Ktedonobacteraceae bacterium]|nr:universal stress protein [Ktedonobacteraceae bacterium]
MFTSILVPLDGSERAESAIAVAARIARATNGSVKLIRVVSYPLDSGNYLMQPVGLSEEAMEIDLANATDYLNKVAASADLTGIPTETQVYSGLPAEAIISFIHEQEVSLVVMCSHGDTGFKRWIVGSVAQKVARHSTAPVLVLRQDSVKPDSGSMRMLVALDGSLLAEAALMPAAQLCIALSAPAAGELHLLRVLSLPTIELGAREELLRKANEEAITEARGYLSALEQRLREEEFASFNLSITSSLAIDLDVASTIIGAGEVGEQLEGVGLPGCDAIAMATHGRSGLQRWVMGSMTERVLGATKLPLLIVRPKVASVQSEKAQEEEEAASWVGLL